MLKIYTVCSYVCSLFTGFIDFIVSPTMSVLGDVLEAILRGLEPNKKKQDSDSVKEVQKDKVNTELGKTVFFLVF